MNKNFKIFYWGLLISFLGSLPLGTVNVTATHISVESGVKDATLFALGCFTVETICVYVVLFAMKWVVQKQHIFRMFEISTVILLLILSVTSFTSAYQMKSFGSSVFTAYSIAPYLLGLLLSILNPMHIPFWFGWTTVLINKNIFTPGKKNMHTYVAGISIGTLLGFEVFIIGGNYIVRQLHNKQNMLNWIIGFVLLITVVIQLYKMKRKKQLALET